MKKTESEADKKNTPYYSEVFKRQIIEEYLKTGSAKMQIQAKYGIKFKSAICTWMRKLGYSDPYQKVINLDPVNQFILTKQPELTSVSTLELEAKIKLLEKQLEDERLLSEMLNRMVDLAEKTYKIPVRKNSSTK